MDSFREQRAADLQRAAGRGRVLDVAHKTSAALGRYVSSRRSQAQGEPVVRIRWGRVVFALLAVGGVVVGIVKLVG